MTSASAAPLREQVRAFLRHVRTRVTGAAPTRRIDADMSDQLRDVLKDLSPTSDPGHPGNLGAAAEHGVMFLAFQPEVDLRTSRIVAVEALVRWRHPELGDVTPESFISIAESSDLIMPLGAWVLDESLRQFAVWTTDMPEIDITMRVNVSPTQLADPGLVPMVQAALAEHGIAGDRLCVEITESFRVDDVPKVTSSLRELRRLGVTSAIDDLASGYSSLGRLRWLPVDTVKIDRSLVKDIDTDERAQIIVAAVLRLAESLHLEVVAEGVEHADEAMTLLKLGCLRGQGHRFGRPVDGAHMADTLARQARGRPVGNGPRPRP